MSNMSNMIDSKKDTGSIADAIQETPSLMYILGISLNIMLALILGALTNHAINIVGNQLGFGIHIKIVLQTIIIALVVFVMKKIAKYIPQDPQLGYSYDVIFVTLYMGSQENFFILLDLYR